MTENKTSLNFITSNKVSEKEPGILVLEGDGFSMEMKYNSKTLSPKIEVTEITDSGLSRYWDTITRIVLEVKNPKLKGFPRLRLILPVDELLVSISQLIIVFLS